MVGLDITIQEFVEKVGKNLYEYFGEENEVRYSKVRKNNGILLSGITVCSKKVNISPTIYMEGYYQRYLNGETYSQLIREIIGIIEKYRLSDNIEIEFFEKFDKISSYIRYKLINTEKNRELLCDLPHRDYLDLSIVYFLELPTELNPQLSENTMSTILINNCHADMWGINEETLYRFASEYTQNIHPDNLLRTEDIIASLNKRNVIDMDDMIVDACNNYMFVLTNDTRLYGAATILYRNELSKIADKCGGSNFYILPSSIHEMIIVIDKMIDDSSFLGEMVREVNSTQIEPEDFLSNSVYYYDVITNNITIV